MKQNCRSGLCNSVLKECCSCLLGKCRSHTALAVVENSIALSVDNHGVFNTCLQLVQILGGWRMIASCKVERVFLLGWFYHVKCSLNDGERDPCTRVLRPCRWRRQRDGREGWYREPRTIGPLTRIGMGRRCGLHGQFQVFNEADRWKVTPMPTSMVSAEVIGYSILCIGGAALCPAEGLSHQIHNY